MKKYAILTSLILALFAAPSMAAAPASNQPAYDPNIPVEFGSGRAAPLVPLPPQVPQFLPNGAVNLDYVWTQDGGARLYWNDVIIPKELKMAGASWIDPALVPQLVPDSKSRAVRRYYSKAYRRPARKRTVAKAKVPPRVASTSLKSPAIPLPLTPVAEKPAPVPPLKAAQASPADQEVVTVTPPRLQ